MVKRITQTNSICSKTAWWRTGFARCEGFAGVRTGRQLRCGGSAGGSVLGGGGDGGAGAYGSGYGVAAWEELAGGEAMAMAEVATAVGGRGAAGSLPSAWSNAHRRVFSDIKEGSA